MFIGLFFFTTSNPTIIQANSHYTKVPSSLWGRWVSNDKYFNYLSASKYYFESADLKSGKLTEKSKLSGKKFLKGTHITPLYCKYWKNGYWNIGESQSDAIASFKKVNHNGRVAIKCLQATLQPKHPYHVIYFYHYN